MSSNLPPGCTDHDIDVAAGYWDCDDMEPEPFYNREQCIHCKREFMQNDLDRKWYLADEVEQFGMDHCRRWDYDYFSLENTQQGWVCNSCAGDPEYLP